MSIFPKITFALIQTTLFWEDKEKNLQHFSEKIRSIDFNCDVVILPEMFSTGFTMNAKLMAEKMDGNTINWFKLMAAESECIITGSFIAVEDNKFYNRLIWMRPDGTYEKYDKKHLFRMAGEDNYYTSGNKNITIDYKGWKIRPQICYDLRFPVWSRNRYSVYNKQAKAEYDVLIYVANWPAVRNLPWDILLRARAVENQCYCIGVNRIGRDGTDKEYDGHSAIIGPKGDYLLDPVISEDGVFRIELNYEDLHDFREKFPQGLDADDFILPH